MTRNIFLKKLRSQYNEHSQKYAISFQTSNNSMCLGATYNSLSIITTQLANYLLNIFPERNVYVGVCTNSKKTAVILILAVWKNYQSFAALNSKNFVFMCKSLQIKYIITDKNQNVDTANYQWVSTFKINDGSVFSCYVSNKELRGQEDLDICYALCTSGSTGSPKIVQVPWTCIHKNIEELEELFKVTNCDTIASIAPYTFDPFFVELMCSLIGGANLFIEHGHLPLALIDDAAICNVTVDRKFDLLVANIATPTITILQTTPSIFRFLISQDTGLFRDLKTLILGGEIFPDYDFSKMNANIYNIYGITEISCWSFIHEVDKRKKVTTIGRPLRDIRTKLEDGELLIGSGTRKCLLSDEKLEIAMGNDLLYRRTGDMVEINPQGEIQVIGRKGDLIKKFGTRVSLTTSKKMLSHCSIIKDSCIIFEPGNQTIGWFLVVQDNNVLDLERISPKKLREVSEIIDKLDAFEKPDLLFQTNKMPLNDHGKTDLRKLRNTMKQSCERRSESVQKIFEETWCEVLSLRQLDTSTTFQESGGTSVQAVKFVTQLNALNVHTPKLLISQLLGKATYGMCLHTIVEGNKRQPEITPPDDFYKLSPESPYEKCLCMSVEWSYNMKKCIDASPQVLRIDGKQYVSVGSHSAQLSMVDCNNGQALWNVELGDRIESGIAVGAEQERLFTGCYDHNIYSLSVRTGEVIWKYRTNGIVKSTPVMSSDSQYVYCGSYDKQMYCLSAKNGELVSSLSLRGSVLATPLFCNSLLIIATLDGMCSAVEANSFQTVWQRQFKSPIFSSPCSLEGGSKVMIAEVEGRVHCLHTDTGYEESEFVCGGNIFSGLTPIFDKNLVVFGCHDRNLYLLEFQTNHHKHIIESSQEVKTLETSLGSLSSDQQCVDQGPRLIWKLLLESPITSTPAFHSDLIVCAASVGVMYLISLQGVIMCRLKLEGEIFSSAIFKANFVYVGCRNDELVCVKISSKDKKADK